MEQQVYNVVGCRKSNKCSGFGGNMRVYIHFSWHFGIITLCVVVPTTEDKVQISSPIMPHVLLTLCLNIISMLLSIYALKSSLN
jgi:hypothetical protein